MSGFLLPIDITTPIAWKRHWARRISGTPAILTVAFCPSSLMFGPELIWGYAKGLGFGIGPIWIGAAVALPTPTESHTNKGGVE